VTALGGLRDGDHVCIGRVTGPSGDDAPTGTHDNRATDGAQRTRWKEFPIITRRADDNVYIVNDCIYNLNPISQESVFSVLF
jgi:hypothetical protein